MCLHDIMLSRGMAKHSAAQRSAMFGAGRYAPGASYGAVPQHQVTTQREVQQQGQQDQESVQDQDACP